MRMNIAAVGIYTQHISQHARHLLRAMTIPATVVLAGWMVTIATATNAHAATRLASTAKTTESTVQATSSSTTQRTTRVQKKSGPRIIKGSEENERERKQRLLRECKGRPNAGACLGYAS